MTTTLADLGLGADITLIPNDLLSVAMDFADALASADREAVIAEARRRLASLQKQSGAAAVPPEIGTPYEPLQGDPEPTAVIQVDVPDDGDATPELFCTVDPADVVRALGNVLPFASAALHGRVQIEATHADTATISGACLWACGEEVINCADVEIEHVFELDVPSAKRLLTFARDAQYEPGTKKKRPGARVVLKLAVGGRVEAHDGMGIALELETLKSSDIFAHAAAVMDRLESNPPRTVETPVTISGSLLKPFLSVKSDSEQRGDDRIRIWCVEGEPAIGARIGSSFVGCVAPIKVKGESK